MQKLKLHLESYKYRYVDNDPGFFHARLDSLKCRDEEWFRRNKIPSFKDFIYHKKGDIAKHIETKSELYDMLSDDLSKDTLITVAAYGLLGHKFVKFPFYVDDFYDKQNLLHNKALSINSDENMNQRIAQDAFGTGYRLFFYNTSPLGMDAKLYTLPFCLYLFICENVYSYTYQNVNINITPGDYVLDCGGCFGDTAIYFASKAKQTGAVFTFEAHPLYLELMKYNIDMNDHIKNNISIIEKILYDNSGEKIDFFIDRDRSATECHSWNTSGDKISAVTTTIDDEVKLKNIPKVDFIKMDIEGAELRALNGARETLSRFKPKLAICVYHKPEDYSTIPQMIRDLGLGYKFYLKHHYVSDIETVLYAIAA